MGKYTKVIVGLPRILSSDAARQVKVDRVKQELLNNLPRHASAFAQRYASLRAEKEHLKNELKAVELELEAVTQLLTDIYEAEGVQSVKLRSGAVIRQQVEPYAQVRDRDEFRIWCLRNELERSLMLPWPKTNAITKDMLLKGLNPPQGVDVFQKSKFVFQKGDEPEEIINDYGWRELVRAEAEAEMREGKSEEDSEEQE